MRIIQSSIRKQRINYLTISQFHNVNSIDASWERLVTSDAAVLHNRVAIVGRQRQKRRAVLDLHRIRVGIVGVVRRIGVGWRTIRWRRGFVVGVGEQSSRRILLLLQQVLHFRSAQFLLNQFRGFERRQRRVELLVKHPLSGRVIAQLKLAASLSLRHQDLMSGIDSIHRLQDVVGDEGGVVQKQRRIDLLHGIVSSSLGAVTMSSIS